MMELLSAGHKRRFFRRLDALLAAPRSQSARATRALGGCGASGAAVIADGSVAQKSIGTARRELGESAEKVDQEPNAAEQDPEQEKLGSSGAIAMARDLSNVRAMAAGKKKRKSSSAAADGKGKLKRGKQAATADPGGQLLAGKRVLLVSVGPDVSRRRLEIWRDMVVKLGGEVVDTVIRGRQQAVNAIDWSSVHIAIASAQLEIQKAKEHLGEGFPPENVEVYTHEWLVYLLRERKMPPRDASLAWSPDPPETVIDEADIEEEKPAAAKQHEDSESDDDGSNPHNQGTGEIQRAKPIHFDDQRIREENAKLQLEKDKLVAERTAAFFKNNPGFVVLSERDGYNGTQKLKQLQPGAFVCQQSSLTQANLNAHITDQFDELMEFLHVERDIWREYMYKKVISSLKAMRTRVCSVSDLKGMKWAKGRLRDKVVQVLETGRLEKLEAKKKNPRLRALVDLARIWGVGPATAAKLYNMGYKSLDDLRRNDEAVLSPQQHIGLKHYDDFLAKIPRAEVAEIEKTVVDEVHKMIPNAKALACGSYRRGKTASGDCDVLITDPDEDECYILPELLKRLHASGFLTDDLTQNYEQHRGEGRCDTYMGVCRLSPSHRFRRLDIKVYPRRKFGFALLYFTGSDHFNRSMRLYARKKGWTLSDRELKRVMRTKGGLKVDQGESVVCESEVDVFIALGLEYKAPTERNCFDIRFIEEDEAAARRGVKGLDDSAEEGEANSRNDAQ